MNIETISKEVRSLISDINKLHFPISESRKVTEVTNYLNNYFPNIISNPTVEKEDIIKAIDDCYKIISSVYISADDINIANAINNEFERIYNALIEEPPVENETTTDTTTEENTSEVTVDELFEGSDIKPEIIE
jgi:hypothetical protein